MAWYLRLICVCALALALIVHPIRTQLALAQEGLPVEIQAELLAAARQGDDALLDAVSAAVEANPDLAQAIVDEAILLIPDLEERIVTAAVEAGGDVQVAAAVGPALGLAPVLAGVAGLGAAGAAVAAAGGGAGGGGAAGGGETPPPTTPEDFETAEYDAQFGLGLVNASSAYARGLTGAGVTVAVLDTGLDTTHPEFAGRIAPGGFDFVTSTPNLTDPNGHGTAVAGVIAANRNDVGMHGVAFGAQVLPFRIFNAAGGFPVNTVPELDDYLAGVFDVLNDSGAPIANHSYRIPDSVANPNLIRAVRIIDRAQVEQDYPDLIAAIQRSVEAGQIHVVAAGNFGLVDPLLLAGAPHLFPELLGNWVAAVSVDADGTLSDFSNKCGVAAAFCIAAPGGFTPPPQVVAPRPGGDYQEIAGTSFAAPHVAGALAILMELFPGVPPADLLDRMFVTANKVGPGGIYANADLYGQGLLDLDAATNTVGAVAILTGETLSGPTHSLAETRINLGPAFGDGLKASLTATQLTIFDAYGAPFHIALAPFVQLADNSFDMESALARFGQGTRTKTVDLGNEMEVSYRFSSSPRIDGEREVALGELSFKSDVTKNTEVLFNFNASPALAFGVLRSGAVDPNETLSTGAFAAPYLSFAEQGYNIGTRTELGKGVTFNVSSFFGQPKDNDEVTAFGSTAELALALGKGDAGLQLGALAEQDTFLGTLTEGAFDLESGTKTMFAGLSGSVPVSTKIDLVGSVYAGLSQAPTGSDSLFSDMSVIRTEAFTMGAIGKNILQNRDRLGFLVNQPLRVSSGTATISAVTGRDQAGNLFKTSFDADVAPTGRELDLEVFYNVQMADETDLSLGAMLRTDPGHVKGAGNEGVFMMRFDHKF